MAKQIPDDKNLSILLVTHNFPPRGFGGSEIYALDVAQELKKFNIKVTVTYPVANGKVKDTFLRDYLYQGIQVIEIVSNHFVISHITEHDSGVEKCFENILNDEHYDLIHFQHILVFH